MTAPAATPQTAVWPLFTVAALSFVPFIGIFFGCAGATWGLVSSRRYAIRAAMIAMAGGLLNIVGIMVFGYTSFNRSVASGGGEMTSIRQEMAKRDMLKIVFALEAYHTKEHSYPAALQSLPGHGGIFKLVGLVDQSSGSFRSMLTYQYRPAADGESYDLFGVGPDNKPGTADDIRPVLPDSLVGHSGLRPQLSGGNP